MPRRKPGSLIAIELSILDTALRLRVQGIDKFHGFVLAKELQERRDGRLLTAHGTLYKALDRLRELGFLESEWEDPTIAAHEGRPRRRFYILTAAGEAAFELARDSPVASTAERRKGLASS